MPVFRQQRDAEPQRTLRRPRPHRASVDADLAALGRRDAEEHLGDLGAAGADEAEEAQDFAGPTISNRRATSRPEIADVGSSMTSTRASSESARAISIAWRSAMPSILTGRRTSISMRRRERSPRALLRIAAQSIRPKRRGWRPT